MDPTSYSMTVLYCTVRLAVYHNLSLPELHSVQMAFKVLPHTCVFFGVASEMLLQIEPKRFRPIAVMATRLWIPTIQNNHQSLLTVT